MSRADGLVVKCERQNFQPVGHQEKHRRVDSGYSKQDSAGTAPKWYFAQLATYNFIR
jgi:hypothetical protein